jgi:hypothetical protein
MSVYDYDPDTGLPRPFSRDFWVTDGEYRSFHNPEPGSLADQAGVTRTETAPMKDSELGQFVCVIHPPAGCLLSPDITIRSDGVWAKTGQLWSSGHARCVRALKQDGTP